jgi:hypothetical protein
LAAWVAERVDARDLKSLGVRPVPVRVRPQAPIISASYKYRISFPKAIFASCFQNFPLPI